MTEERAHTAKQRGRNLYPLVLGPAWTSLPEAIRRCHGVMRARASMTVTRGASLLARLIGVIARFPRSAPDVETAIDVVADDELQRWRRSFAGHELVTTQYLVTGGSLVERSGLVELCLEASAENGHLVVRSARARVCLGPLRIPLPRWLTPRAEARAWVEADDGSSMEVEVRIAAPFAGELLRYRGRVWPLESPTD